MESDLPPPVHEAVSPTRLAENLQEKLSFPRSRQPVRLPELQTSVNWNLVLFGKLFSSNYLQVTKIEEQLNRQWKLNTPIQIKPVQRSIFQLEVSSLEEKNFILNEGPWLVGGHIFSVKSWEKDKLLEDLDFKMVDFWVQIYQLPVERLNELNASVLGSGIGTVVKTDPARYPGEFGAFVRVKVSLDIKLPLPDCVEYLNDFGQSRKLKIRIERLIVFCFNCGKLGHEKRACSNREFLSSSVIKPTRRYNGSLRGSSPEKKRAALPDFGESRAHQGNTATTEGVLHNNTAAPSSTSEPAATSPKDPQGTSSPHASCSTREEEFVQQNKDSSSQSQKNNSSLKRPVIRRKEMNVGSTESTHSQQGGSVSVPLKRSRNLEEDYEKSEVNIPSAKPRLSASLGGCQGEDSLANPWRVGVGSGCSEGDTGIKASTAAAQELNVFRVASGSLGTAAGCSTMLTPEGGGGSATPILNSKEKRDVTRTQQKNLRQ